MIRQILTLTFAIWVCLGANAQMNIRETKGLFFTIQVGSYMTMPRTMGAYSKFGVPVNHEVSQQGMNRISLGRFPSFSEAEKFLNTVQSKGTFPGAFLTAYMDGAKVTVSEAKVLAQGKDPASAERALAYSRSDNEAVDEQKAQEEADRIAQEQAEAEKQRQDKEEAERIAAEQAEVERKAAEEAAKAEAERLAAEQAAKEEAERIAAEEAKQAEERAEAEKATAEAEVAEAEKQAQERAEAEEAEKKAAEKAAAEEAERIAAEKAAKEEAERIAAEQAEAERKAAEEASKAEAERLAAEKAKQDSIAMASKQDSATAQPMNKVDSILAQVYNSGESSSESSTTAKPKTQGASIFKIRSKKILYDDTVTNKLDGPEFVYNLVKGDRLMITASEVKGKSMKGYKVLRYDDSMKKFDNSLPVAEGSEKYSTMTEEMVEIGRDGVYKVKLIQPNNALRKIYVLIEKKSRNEENLRVPFSTNVEQNYTYTKNEGGKSAINTNVKAYYERKSSADQSFGPSDLFIHEREVEGFSGHLNRGKSYPVVCCLSGKENRDKNGFERPIMTIYKFQKGDTVLVSFSGLKTAKGKSVRLKSFELTRYGSNEPIYKALDVASKKFAFVAGYTGFYSFKFDTYTPEGHSIDGAIVRLPHFEAESNGSVEQELVPIYFYEYNAFTKSDDLKFGLAPKSHVDANTK